MTIPDDVVEAAAADAIVRAQSERLDVLTVRRGLADLSPEGRRDALDDARAALAAVSHIRAEDVRDHMDAYEDLDGQCVSVDELRAVGGMPIKDPAQVVTPQFEWERLIERLRQMAESQRMDLDSPHVAMTLDEAADAILAKYPAQDDSPLPGCTGDYKCPAPAHQHGCMSDTLGHCNEPGEHWKYPAQVVTAEWIKSQRDAGWPDMHPEDYCHLCGARNPSWCVDREDWVTATEAWAAQTGREGICCPGCFATMHETATGKTTTWELVPFRVERAQVCRLYDGRVGNALGYDATSGVVAVQWKTNGSISLAVPASLQPLSQRAQIMLERAVNGAAPYHGPGSAHITERPEA